MTDYLKSININGADKYLEEFQGELFVIKCGGSLLENPETGSVILDDIAFLKKQGVNPVLVHGGSVQADKDMQAAGITPRRHKGLRITCDRTIGILSRCFGALNCSLVKDLCARGVSTVGFSGADGGLVLAEKMSLDDVDLGWVGDVTGIARDVWNALDEKQIPVVASLGVGTEGNVFNINADYVATRLALEIKARKLILMTDVDGVCLDPGDPSSLISTLTISRAEELIAGGEIGGGMIPKIESAIRTLRGGIRKIHMINGRKPHSLMKEIFTDHGIGTQIIKD